jgi:hypothetical protein
MGGVSGLREIPMNQPSAPVTESQVGFGPPDNQWRLDVQNLQRNALNVYLVDLRENRKLRSNERVRSVENGVVYEDPAPARMDCHYLVTAWSPTEQITPQVEPVLDEHALLYEAAAVLINNVPLNPSRVYPAGSQALMDWEPFSNIELPTVIAPVEGFPKLAEFWSAMGTGHRWKPVLYLIVTVPVELLREVAGPMVTTRITEYRQLGRPETAEVWIQIGGHVRDENKNAVPGAWVRLETATGEPLQTTETNELGRFTFSDLRAGRYRLRARAVGLGEKERPDVDIPSNTGEYDLIFP